MDPLHERRDLAYRRRMWRVLGITAGLGVLALAGFEAWLRHVEQTGLEDPDRALWQVGFISVLLRMAVAALAALLARYLFDWARQTREQGQWPPAGLQWPGNAPLRHGDDARRVARRLRSLAIASLLLAGLLLAWSAWRLFG